MTISLSLSTPAAGPGDLAEPIRAADCGYAAAIDGFPDWSSMGAIGTPPTAWQASIAHAAADARETLSTLYPAAARYWGALDHVAELATTCAAGCSPEAMAPVLACRDHFMNRALPPRPHAGGTTNSDNTVAWQRLLPYLNQCVLPALHGNCAESFVWRAILARIPEPWIPTDAIVKRLMRRFGGTSSVGILDIRLRIAGSASGGLRWIAEAICRTLADIDRALSRGCPAIIEIITDPWSPPLGDRVVLVHRMTAFETDSFRLDCHDPAIQDGRLRLTIRLSPDRAHIEGYPRTGDQPSIQAIRFWHGAAVEPPYFGLRRYVRWGVPWFLIWRCRRWLRRRNLAATLPTE